MLGLGGMGSAALYHLAKRGVRALGLEQHGIAHARGASHGETRIIRKAYFEHPSYVPLLHRAYALWGEAEALSGERLFERCGLILVGPEDGVVVRGVRNARDEHALDIETWTVEEARRRFPAFGLEEEDTVLYERDAGLLHVEKSVATHARLAIDAGAVVHEHVRVTRWRADARGVSVETEQGRFDAEKLVITAGPWAAEMLSTLALPLRVRRRVQLWFGCADRACDLARGFPVFAFDEAEGFYYGFPSLDHASMKIAAHHEARRAPHAQDADPEGLDRALHPADIEHVSPFRARRLPGLSGDVLRHAACMYTMTPDEHFILDLHPEHANVAYAAGFSGHGFKFASVIGEVLADLSTAGATSAPIDFLRPLNRW